MVSCPRGSVTVIAYGVHQGIICQRPIGWHIKTVAIRKGHVSIAICMTRQTKFAHTSTIKDYAERQHSTEDANRYFCFR